MISTVCLSFALATLCVAPHESAWDDGYAAALREIGSSGGSGHQVAQELGLLLSAWKGLSSYTDIREEAERLEPWTSQLRLEIGSPSGQNYQSLWIIASEDTVWGLQVLDGIVREFALSLDQWESLEAWIRSNRAWHFPSDGDFAMDDGTAYFLSLDVLDQSGQFIVYAPVLGTLTKSEERAAFAERTRMQDRLVIQIIDLFER